MRRSMSWTSGRDVVVDGIVGSGSIGAIGEDDRRLVGVAQDDAIGRCWWSRRAEARRGGRDGDRTSLEVVAVEQRGMCPSVSDPCELPREVVHVRNPTVHAEPADRGGDMSGI